jgi:signal peptidase I
MKSVKKMEIKKEVKQKSFFGKLWYFLWKSDSIWSWIADLILLWIIIKLILFPFFGLLTGAAMPSVIIETGSMQHQANCGSAGAIRLGFDDWWENHKQTYAGYNISKDVFLDFKYHKGTDIGDIIILNGRGKDKLNVGDIIVYNAGEPKPIIHRVISVNEVNGKQVYETYGDNNCGQFSFEKSISQEQIIGKAVFRIPKVGWAKIWVVNGANFILKSLKG